jgi:hypothetical protein
MKGQIEGYVISVGVYVTKTIYISDDDEASAVQIALEEFEANIEGLEFEETDIEVLDVSPEYHEDD